MQYQLVNQKMTMKKEVGEWAKRFPGFVGTVACW